MREHPTADPAVPPAFSVVVAADPELVRFGWALETA